MKIYVHVWNVSYLVGVWSVSGWLVSLCISGHLHSSPGRKKEMAGEVTLQIMQQ